MDGAELLDDVAAFLRRFIVLPEAAVVAIALWVVHTYLITVAEFTPYLRVTSPTRQCGKTNLLRVLAQLVYRPWLVMGASAAALFRRIHKDRPTLLYDEIDSQQANDEVAEAVRNILNSGFAVEGVTTRCTGEGGNLKVDDFSTFCAKAIAGINQLPDTVASRSIEIRIERAARSATGQLTKVRTRRLALEANPLRRRLARFAADSEAELRGAEPMAPPSLGDRQVDIWEPLFAIADLAGGVWPANARLAAEVLHGVEAEEGDPGLLLLADLRELFESGVAHLSTQHIIAELAKREDRPWPEYARGQQITARGVARLLKRFKIKSRNVRDGESIQKGYIGAEFERAWAAYLGARAADCSGVAEVAAVGGPTGEERR